MNQNQILTVLGVGLGAGLLASATLGATMLGLYLVYGLLGAMVSAVLIPSVAGLPRIANPIADAGFAALLGAATMVLVGPLLA